MSLRGFEAFSLLAAGAGAAPDVRPDAKLPDLLRDLVDGRIEIDRLGENGFALVHADGSREALSPEQTAALAMALLRAADGRYADRNALLKLHSLVSATNLKFDLENVTGSSHDVGEPTPPGEDEGRRAGETPAIQTNQSEGGVLQESKRFEPAFSDGDEGQFRTGYTPGFIGPARGHLGALNDENLSFRDSFRRGLTIVDISTQGKPLVSDIGDRTRTDGADQNAFSQPMLGVLYEAGFVGPGLNHLTPLLNEDYRFGDAPPRELGDSRLEDAARRDAPPVPVPPQNLSAGGDEDTTISGTVFPDGIPAGGVVRDLTVSNATPGSVVTIADNGDFTVIPPRDYSGQIAFTYTYIDGTGAERSDTAVVTVRPVVDAPLVSTGGGAFVADEDQALALTGLAAALSDLDGSERLVRIAIEGVPPGMRLVDAAGNPVGLDQGGGVWSFEPGDVEGLVLWPSTHVSGSFNLTLVATSQEQADGRTATIAVPFTVAFRPVADAPALSVGAGSFTGPEDTPIGLSGFAASLVDRDGSEDMAEVSISGVAIGSRFVDGAGRPIGSDVGGGVWRFLPADLADIHFIAPSHVAGVFDMQLAATSREGANGDSATTTLAFSVVTTPAPDAPSVAVGPGLFTGEEDTRIALSALTTALVDQDGSESVSLVRIIGLPPGGILTDELGNPAGVDNGDGSWTLAAGELAGLGFTPPPHLHGEFTLTLEATARESETGGAATTSLPFTIRIDAVADQPIVPPASIVINEDALTVIGPAMTYALVDQDGSETVASVGVTGFPPGSTVVLPAIGGATVTALPGGYRISGPAADIRATLDQLAVQAPANSDGDAVLSVTVTTTDANGSTAITTAAFNLGVAAVADAPTVAGSAAGSEDAIIATPVTVALADADGSETLESVTVSQVPPGAALGWNAALPGVVTDDGGGSFTFRGTTAEINALLLSLTIRPPLHSDADFTLRITATSAETNPTGGQVAVASATTAFDVRVVVAAVADAPLVPASSSRGDEDATIAFGADIGYALVDTDGSEAISSVALSGFPPGAAITYTPSAGATVSVAAGVYTISGAPAGIRATLDSFAVRPPLHADANIAVTVQVTATDTGGATARTTVVHPIIVDAVADAPTVSGVAVGTEDSVPVTITIADTDTDGSQSITSVELTASPAAMLLSWTVQPGAAVTTAAGGVYTITGSESAIRAVLATIVATPPSNVAGTFAIDVRVTSTETSPSEAGEVALASATTSFTIPVVANADADAPNVVVTPVIGNEDAAIAFGTSIVYALVDTDGSEVISSVAISGAPAGATLSYSAAPGAAVANVAGVWTITGTEAAIRATLDTFAVRPGANLDADFALTVAVTSTDAGVSSATTTTAVPVAVRAVADAPTGSGSAAGAEDVSIPLSIAVADTDTDGSQTITSVRIADVPAGGTLTWTNSAGATVSDLGGGVYEIAGAQAAIQAVLASIALTPPANRHGVFNLTVTVTSSESNPSEPGDIAAGLGSAATVFTVPVTIAAVADAPAIAVADASGEEDTRIPLAGLTASLADSDGSEAMTSVRITGVPAGAAFTDAAGSARGVNNGDGSWSFTAAQLTGLHLTPALHWHGVIDLTLEVVATEASNGDFAISTRTFRLTVDAQADAPLVPAGSTAIVEDTVATIGAGILYSLVDPDGSESVTQVEITGFPVSATVSLPAVGASTVTAIPGGYRITGAASDIRATVDGLAVRAPSNSDVDFMLSIAVRTTDADGSTAVTTSPFVVNVAAAADAPTASGSGAGLEDAFIPVPIVVSLGDTDGSESLSSVVVSQIPVGATLAWNTALPGTVVDNGGGAFTFTGSTADIQALLLSLSIRPPLHSDADLILRVVATATESTLSGGQVSILNAVATTDVPVTVDAVADQPTIAVTTSRGDEDAAINFGANIAYSLVDADGSETVSTVTLTGFPAGSTVTYAASGSATVGLALGVYAITGGAADIRATLDSFAVRAPADSDANIAVAVTVTATDTGGVTATRAGTHVVIVDAVADLPTGSGVATGAEDADIPLAITMGVADPDGSETITFVRIAGVPAGGTLNWTNFPGATVVNLGGGVYTISGVESAIRNVLGTVTVRPPLHSDADFDLTVTVRASETNPTTVGEVALLSRDISFTLPVAVAAVADAPTAPNNTTNGTEDAAIVFGSNVAYSLVDTDGSETVTSVALSGIPAGWSLAYAATGGGTVNAAGGVYTITGSPAGIRATLDSFTITPPLDDDADALLSIAVTTTDTGGVTATRNATHAIIVAADADTPTISVGGGTFTGGEDTPITLTGFAAAISDTDASAGRAVSEALHIVRITGVPTGATFQNSVGAAVGANAGGGVWTFAASDLATLRFMPPANLSGVFNMNLEAISRETSNGDLSATASLPFSVTVMDIPDLPSVTTGSSSGNEDATIAFGAGITYATADADGSESISEVAISGVTAGWTISYTVTGGGAVDTSTPGVWRITGTEAGIRATLNTFAITPPLDTDADSSVQVAVTSRDVSGGTATSAPATHTIIVAADADAPSVNVGAGTFNTNEDTRIALAGFAVAITDTDASAGRPVSETISLVRITGVSLEAGTGFQNTAGTAVGANLGGGVWTFTTAQLADLYYVPGTNRAGTYNMVLEATARESSNLDTAVFSRNFTVNVAGVPDQVTVGSGTYNMDEDTQANNMGANFGVALSDNDGSQTLTIILSGLPTGAGSVITYTPSGGVTHSLASGVLTLSGASNLVLTTLNTLDLRAPTNSDANWTVTVTATTSENGTTLSDVVGTRTLRVRAIADTPTISGSVTGNEDATITVPVTVALPDNDGSESFNYVDVRLSGGTPAGTTLNVASVGGATVVYNGGTATWRVTGSTTAVQATLLSGVTVRSATHNGSNITVQVQAQSLEAATGLEVTTATATSAWTNVVVTMTDVADKPDVTVPANQLIEEDTPLALTGLGIVKVDSDGSEVFTLTLAGVPDGSSFGGRGSAGAAVGGVRTWTFTESEVSGLTFTPPLNLHGSWTITATTTARELENSSTAVSDPRTFTITVDAQADAPTVTTTGATGDEDTAIAFGATLASAATGVTLYDTDGSERLFSVAISGFPGGVTPTYSIVGAGSVTLLGGVYTVAGANEADIRATLATFSLTPPLHSDANIPLTVVARTIDADGSIAASSATTHTVVVRAIADQPTLAVGAAASGAEDTNIALSIAADRIDTDGSEVLSVRITLPAGVVGGTISGNTSGGGSIANQGGGVFLVTAPTEAQLDAILSTVVFRPPANWSGTANLTVEAIATETGPEIATATAIRSGSITVTVGSVADPPALKVVPSIGGASGLEDEPIRLSIAVTLPDNDGSETYVVRITGQPAGSSFTNAAGVPIGTQISPGVWEFTPAQVAVLHIVAPLNSSNDFSLNVEAIVSDVGPTGTSVTSLSGVLPVNVIGVADEPTVVSPVTIVSAEDQPIPLGANIVATLVDTDGSESLYYVIAGLPTGMVPSRGAFIGGEWQISAADMPFVTIPAPANFSGNYVATFAPGLSVRAVTQENDGDEAVTNITVGITITPVIDSFSWSPSVTLAEESSIPLAAAAFGGPLPDSDGSERIVSYTINLNGIVAAAQIGGVVASTASFISNYVSGPFTNNGNGTITVSAANMGLVSFSAAAFLNSNVNFSLPISARIEESDGSFQIVNSTFSIAIDGVADIPTVFASTVSGTAGTLMQLNPTGAEFGGLSTDTDTALGRSQSERIYFIVSGLQSNPAVTLAFTNAAGAIVGLDNGDGTWYLEPADLVGLRILSSSGSNGTVAMTLTTVAVENDSGSRAQSATSAAFSVTVLPGSGGTGPAPLPPQVTINVSSANEDGVIPISVNAQPAPGDTTNPTVSVMFSNVPAGFTLSGATFNPATGRWLATAADVNAGLVSLRAPPNWAGSLSGASTIQVEAVAVNSFLNRATTGLVPAPISVTPDADGPAFSASPAPGIEDTAIALNLSVTPLDADASSPEFVVNPIILTIPAGTALSAGVNMGGNVWHVTVAQLPGLSLLPPSNYHGPLSVTVQATTQDVNGDTQAGSTTIGLTVAARADMPNATASNVTGGEDTSIPLAGLSAALVDADGSEVLSVKISGVPEGAIFNAGGNNGDGTWTIPVAALATLAISPPPQFSGTISLNLIAYALETSNGNTSQRTIPFTVTVNPSADLVILDPLNVTTGEDAPVVLPLRVLLEDTLTLHAGENPPEQVQITFTGLPPGSSMSGAGAFVDLGGGSWRFTGSESQANAITFTPPQNYAGVVMIGLSAVTIDGASVLATPATDTFQLTVTPAADAPMLQTNTVRGPTGAPLPLNLFAYPTDADGSESLVVTLSGVPAGTTFSAGADLGGGSWRFTAAQLASLTMTLSGGATDTTINVAATSTESANGSTATTNGNFQLVVGAGSLLLTGTSQADILTGGAGADVVTYAASNAAVTVNLTTNINTGGHAAGDTLTGIEGVVGSTYADLLTGNASDNVLTGGGGNDTINGGDGNDTLDGGTGDDSLTGGLGNDVYIIDSALDQVIELAGQGADEIRTSLSSYSLAALPNVENLTFTGVGNFAGTGNAGANVITGGSGADTLSGGDGADTLIGGIGNDSLSGGNNNDLIIGGQGADTLVGGAGVDTFRYLAGDTAGGVDQIVGFTAGAGGDVIDIDALLPLYDNNPLTLGNYVNLFESGGNTSVRIDAAGTSSFTTTVLTLQGLTGLDLNSLRSNGNLVT